ncbi:MAG: OsmC family protein [Thermoplasmatota archaeon]|nr:OsmC family protein [Candidatus Thermoplasmatota archaeon]MBU1914202.1 OsmC family protein [Candidatus Thermoplasmatota archaeon]
MNEKIHTHMKREDGYKFSITFDELPGAKLYTDEPIPIGKSKGPSAGMMLSSAVGHCLSSSLLFSLEKSRAKPNGLETDVETTLARNEKGRWRVSGIKVTMRIDVDDVDKDKLERCKGIFEDFCIVSASVREGIEISVDLSEK